MSMIDEYLLRAEENRKVHPPGIFKICPVCGRQFTPSEFHVNTQTYCSRKCQGKDWRRKNKEKMKAHINAYNKEYYLNLENKRRHKERVYIRYRDLRKEAREKLCQGVPKCIRCGFTDMRALEIDHICGGGHEERKTLKNGYALYRRIINTPLEELKQKYQVLCSNCNSIKRFEENEFAKSTKEAWY